MEQVNSMEHWEEYILTHANVMNLTNFYKAMDGIYKICERTMYTNWDKKFCDRLVKMFIEKEIF